MRDRKPTFDEIEARANLNRIYAASQDAEILRLRGALADMRDECRKITGGIPKHFDSRAVSDHEVIAALIEVKCDAALSSPAPQDDVIVRRELLGELLAYLRTVSVGGTTSDESESKLIAGLAALLGAPSRG